VAIWRHLGSFQLESLECLPWSRKKEFLFGGKKELRRSIQEIGNVRSFVRLILGDFMNNNIANVE